MEQRIQPGALGLKEGTVQFSNGRICLADGFVKVRLKETKQKKGQAAECARLVKATKMDFALKNRNPFIFESPAPDKHPECTRTL